MKLQVRNQPAIAVSIRPSIAKGKMRVPPSKSMAHRFLICAGLSFSNIPDQNVSTSASKKRGVKDNTTQTIDRVLTSNATKILPHSADVTQTAGCTATSDGIKSLSHKANTSQTTGCAANKTFSRVSGTNKTFSRISGTKKTFSRVSGIELSDDILATIDCLRKLGAHVDFDETHNVATVVGTAITGLSGTISLSCRECASTVRFFTALSLVSRAHVELQGSQKLFSRPLDVYEDICASQGLKYNLQQNCLRVQGPLTPAHFKIPGNISSQFISGLLFACPLLCGKSTIEVVSPLESKPYLDMTLQALKTFGIKIEAHQDESTGNVLFSVPGKQRYCAHDVCVEGDYSSAAVFDAFNTIGGKVELVGLNAPSLQGDKIYSKHFLSLDGPEAAIDLTDCPDLGPILMAVAALKHGAVFVGAKRLQYKESNRGQAMADELKKCGINVVCEDGGNCIRVLPTDNIHSPTKPFFGHHDHRIVMALAFLCSKVGGVIEGAEAVRKSMPDFFSRLEKLGIELRINEMD